MSRSHYIDRKETRTLAAGQQPPQIQARNLHHDREHATLCLHARREADGAEQATALERRVRAAIAIFADAVDDDVEAARQDAREILALVVDRRRAQDRKSTRLNSSHLGISYAVFCLKKKT